MKKEVKNWSLKIEDPSGETRNIMLDQEPIQLTRLLRDATVPQARVEISRFVQDDSKLPVGQSPFWLEVSGSETALKLGESFFQKGQLPASVSMKMGETKITLERKTKKAELPEFPRGCAPWLTVSESGKKILWNVKKAAATQLSIYVGGETGTGKEVLAGLIHAWSPRASGPFIPINCGALSASLAESELFGHTKGAYTGAHKDRPGALLQAHGGTLFLDEIADLSLDLQVKLLRFLENGEIRPVGGDRIVHASTRLICATHKPLRKLVEEGKFRQDLYFRLASVTIEIPPLRHREDDVEMLAHRFVADLGKVLGPSALYRLKVYGWPGNVRELRHTIERAAGLSSPFQPQLTAEDFDFLIQENIPLQTPEMSLGAGFTTLKDMEKAMILKALRISSGHRGIAAQVLGVARSTLFDMMRRHQIMGPNMKMKSLTQDHFGKKDAFDTSLW